MEGIAEMIGISLDWWPEPTVSVRGSRHRTSMHVDAHPSASARIVESVVLGRHEEPPGRLAPHQRIVIDGTPVLDQELAADDQRTLAGRALLG